MCLDGLSASVLTASSENFQLRAQIAQLKAENAQVEETVRQDVCEELSKQIEAMEHACKLRIEDERLAMDHKWKRQLHILSREIARRAEDEADWAICQLETKVQDLQDQLGQLRHTLPRPRIRLL
jgi:chromosome segregation ATPase